MRIQERCFLLAAAGLCLLGGIAYSLTIVDAEARITTTPGASDEETATTQSSQSEPRNDTAESRNAYPTKESDIKATTEAKKKPVVDFKVKSDQKYQKPSAKDDDAKKAADDDASATLSTTSPVSSMKPDESAATTKSMNAPGVTIPFLLHGEPFVGTVATTPASSSTVQEPTSSSTEEARVTEETTSSRGRALNISAPEPTNSLHANITDLSDVSMDEDDKEVEGGEYVASHNETSINISSTLLPKVPECVHGNRTYSLDEKVVRDCEEKCVCTENGIADCQPLCVQPYVRAGRAIEDHLCQEKIVAEEPCCAVILCAADSAPEPEETCIFGNQTVARGQRVEDGCSKVCICEAGGHLKCQARCPPNETTSIANQHDRCVQLSDPRDNCCTITLCDVTLGDHEIKAENSTDLSVQLMDVKVLNSTAIKLKLSAKNPQDVTIEISQDNRVWSRQKPDKDGVVSTLEPAHTYHVRVVEGARTGPAIQVSLPAEVVKVTNITEKMSDKNSCNHRGKSYKIGAEWYDECLHFCICTEGGKSECVSIECPTDFGLDVLDSSCLDWETVPPDFKPQAPNCCPQEVRCRNNGSCLYEDIVYDNWSRLPMNVTGCEQECYCEMGNVSCRAACNPVPALPPANMCPYQDATLASQPDNPCCLQWTCVPPSAHAPGMNVTTAYPGPLATDTFDRQTIDNSKRPNNKSETFKPSQEPERGTSSLWGDSKTHKTQPDATTIHGLPHYPMDPGHPTAPYNGPYSPDYVPTHPTVENVFHLPTHLEKPMSTPKEKSKSKSDNKKPVEPMKSHKDMIDQYFPGPLAPNRFHDKITSTSPYSVNENQYMSGSLNPNKLPPQRKDVLINHPPLVSLNPHPDMLGPLFPYVSNSNKGNVPPASFNGQFDSSARPPYRGPVPVNSDTIDPNIIGPSVPKKKAMPSNPFVDADKTKAPPILPGRPKQGQRNPEQEILPEQLYHLINLHPGLTQLDQAPPQGHPGLYDLHQQISGQKQPPNDRGQPDYFGTPSSAPKKVTKPHILAQKNENGQTTYHIHTPDIPTSPQQLEELLAHITQHDPNPGPFQHYPGQPAIPHNVPNGPPTPPILPLHIDAHIPHSGLTHLNHPFAAQTPNQSGLDHNIVPPGFPLPGSIPGFPAAPPSNEVTVQILEALDEHTVRLVFTVPQVLVGLHGRVELRYTSDKTKFDPSMWKLQVFAPPNDLIATQQLEFELSDLEPTTEYKVKITVRLKDLNNSPSSKIYSVRTLEKRADEATLPPQIPIDAELRAMEMNSSWVNIMWKKLTDYELQFIDGVQLRYKEHDGKVYAATPLIHRSVTNYVIENLKPATKYEVGIYFIPFAGQTTELISEKTIDITTSMEPDPYSFDVKVEIKTIKSTDVEVTWSGVPYPEDKYVNIYRAIYQSDTGKEDTSTFKIAKRDSHAKTVISDLKPGTRYRLWLEIYLTNGRIKKSNVQDFVTKPGVLLPATVSQQAGKLASLPLHEGDYYGPLVIVAIVASLAILSTLILLMMLMKRRSSSKADISPRKTTSAYDNPSYKTCEDAVTISNGRSKTTTDHEMTTINSNAKETA